MKRQFLEERYAKIAEAARCCEAGRRELAEEHRMWSLGTWVLLSLSSLTWDRVLSF